MNIKRRSPEKGHLGGNCKPFGITVNGIMHAAGVNTRIEIAATLTNKFDTFGLCPKKISEISDRLIDLAPSSITGSSSRQSLPDISQQEISSAPSYSKRAGVSYKGKALAGFWLSLGGLFFGPAAIGGLIMCGQALAGMSTSNNKSGQGWATAGIVVGFIAVLGWICLLLAL